MDQQYETAVRTTEQLHNKIRDLLDDPNHPLSRQLLEETRRLYDDSRSKKNPRSLEDQTQGIMQILQQIRSGDGSIMSYGDIDFLHKNYEQLMMGFRKFENY